MIPSLYTATRANIRDETAELADIAMNEENKSGYSDTITDDVNARPLRPSMSEHSRSADERTLILQKRQSYGAMLDSCNVSSGPEAIKLINSQWSSVRPRGKHFHATERETLSSRLRSMSNVTWKDVCDVLVEPVRTIPAVILGLFLNILDGVSYGMITFPTSMPIFANFGGDGVSMFFVTCVISQLVYTLGGSIFKGGNGSMMIEVVPFYRIIAKDIASVVGEENPTSMIATMMVAYALSSILTGFVFLMLGALHLGVLISYFPRHILVGCIGGVGVFLMETGFAVTARLESESGFKYDYNTLQQLTASVETVLQWLIPLSLAVLLNFISARFHHPMLIPTYFFMVLVLFYVIAVGIMRLDMSVLWNRGWVFDIQEASEVPFYRFYTYFDFRQTSWKAIWATLPSQMALVFFGILHVPLNVPALGVSVGEDNVDTDRELVAHGVSNVTAGLFGTVPNYLCYVNSVLFYRVGGGSRLSGLMLAGATAIVLLIGPSPIAYLPTLVVGALIFVLGLDLIYETLVDTWHRVSRLEYITIMVIVVVMTLSDFVVGCLVGVALACVFFVMQTSRRNAVRTVLSGTVARSTVRRQLTQRRFLEDVGNQTKIFKLQGSLFFGTVNSIESLVRKMLDLAEWQKDPISFLILDFSLVSTMDFSAVEAMSRIHRMLNSKHVNLVFCGLSLEGDVAVSLRSANLWADETKRLDVFASLNEALEWTENEYIRGLYMSSRQAGQALRRAMMPGPSALRFPTANRTPAVEFDHVDQHSPRYEQLQEAARRVTQNLSGVVKPKWKKDTSPGPLGTSDEDVAITPTALLWSTLGPYADASEPCDDLFELLSAELQEITIPKGTVVWDWGEMPDALYFIESGILMARYVFSQNNYEINEAMLAGTIAGELTFLAQQPRNTMVTSEMDAKVWRLDGKAAQNLARHDTHAYNKLIQLLLRVSSDEQDCLMSYLVSRLS